MTNDNDDYVDISNGGWYKFPKNTLKTTSKETSIIKLSKYGWPILPFLDEIEQKTFRKGFNTKHFLNI